MATPVHILSGLTATPCLKEIGAVVDVFVAKLRRPESFAVPANAVVSKSVDGIAGCVNGSQVCNPVVGSIAVNVVEDFWRLLSVMQEPSNTVSKVGASVKAYSSVSPVERASNGTCSNTVASLTEPTQFTRIRAIAQHFTDVLWNNLCSHFVLPHNLVRGLGTAIPSYPIIPRSLGDASQ